MKSRVYLIDYENVHKEGLEGAEALSRSDRVIVFYSVKADSISIDTLNKCKAKIEFIKAEVGTLNAMDFQLVGYLFYHMKKNRDYYIITRDQGFRAILNMAKNLGMSVKIKAYIGEKDLEDKVIKFSEADKEMTEYGIDSRAIVKVASLIRTSIGIVPTPDVLQMVIDGIKNYPTKADFYLYCTRTLGQAPGQAFYSSIKKKFLEIKEIVDLAS
ncbi:MAG: hypothetical protein J6I68_00940 [Butyrivibrio sp.]|uniref:PIN domain-containing protein n=1 Tax=Butyrivibrio sp. TaxID=28121 RepID=UPI001B524C28|nr:PIN domain-containing protein [Butyrivibrio sp.]MBP3781793.1 hypothetical protein [Butyrivibrio sp.]